MLISDLKYQIDCINKKCKIDYNKWGTNEGVIVDVDFIDKDNVIYYMLINENVEKLQANEFEVDYKNNLEMSVSVVCNKCGEKKADGLFKFDFKNKSIEYVCNCGELNIIAGKVNRSDERTLPNIKVYRNR